MQQLRIILNSGFRLVNLFLSRPDDWFNSVGEFFFGLIDVLWQGDPFFLCLALLLLCMPSGLLHSSPCLCSIFLLAPSFDGMLLKPTFEFDPLFFSYTPLFLCFSSGLFLVTSPLYSFLLSVPSFDSLLFETMFKGGPLFLCPMPLLLRFLSRLFFSTFRL
jgi:hypothetical protein